VKIGKYEIPDLRLYPLLVEATKKIYEKFGSEEATDQLAVAQLIGHKSVSGAFLTKLACLRAYGLIEKRGIKVTNIGKRLTYGATEEERNEALKEAILSIPLWKEFYGKWGVKLPTVDFWVDLGKITGLEAPDAQKVEKIVRNAYLEDVKYIKAEKELEKEVIKVTPEAKVDTSTAIPEGVLGRVTVKDVGYIDVKDKTTYEIAKAYLRIFAEKLGIKEEPEEEG
jgi:hypothetical protein